MADDIFSKNYFEIFGIPVSYAVDLSQLSDTNRELQKQFHPDRYAAEGDEATRLAMQKTSLINQAYDVLKDSIARGQYLLKMKDVDMQGDTDTSMDHGFLMEQMEFREAIAEVQSKDDPLDVLDAMAADTKQKLQQLQQQFANDYSNNHLQAARDTVRKMQFLIKAQKEISAISEQLEDELF
ncbi:MAG: Fe-S protein assembly co-chaperone HscB [Gammaproteobacteria bacterium]